MGRVIVHLGVHRTATTLLQQTLRQNASILAQNGVEVLVPPKTRSKVFDGLVKRPSARTIEDKLVAEESARKLRNRLRRFRKSPSESLFVSEENILGTMRECRDSCMLYPELQDRLQPYHEAFAEVDYFVLGIRQTHHWWCSALSYTVKEYAGLPSQQVIDAIVSKRRGWKEVISDIRTMFPDTPLIVREHPYATDTLGSDLAEATNLPALAQLEVEERVSNASATQEVLQQKLRERGEGDAGVGSAFKGGVFDPFSTQQARELAEQYETDRRWLLAAEDDGFRFYPSVITPSSIKQTSQAASSIAPICLLHIGKTGGSYLRGVLKEAPNLPPNLKVLKHSDTLETTKRKFGEDRRLAFVIREPAERFVSAFNSRLRQGRPRYNSLWSAAEASAFQWFESANSLAEALGSPDERTRSAAYFAMEHIQHLKLNYRHYLSSIEALQSSVDQVALCIDLDDLDPKLPEVLRALGINEAPVTRGIDRHASQSGDEVLSEAGSKHLKEYWRDEFEIYSFCKQNFAL